MTSMENFCKNVKKTKILIDFIANITYNERTVRPAKG